jgi:iron complex transport system substrate-binding protein
MISRRKVVPYLTGFVLGCLILWALPDREISREPHPWHAQTAPDGTYPMEIVDDYARTVRLEKQPRYFISLAPGITELIYAMEMGDHLMAVTEWCDSPEAARALRDAGAQVGRIDQPDRERIAAYGPDLIIASNLTPPDVLETLEGPSKTRCIALKHDSFEDLISDIATLGTVTGVPGKALQLQLRLKAAWKETEDRLRSDGVFSNPPAQAVFLLGIEENSQPGWTPGDGVWVSNLMKAANAANVAADIGPSWGELSLENLLLLDPEVILIRQAPKAADQLVLEQRVTALKKHPVWEQIRAVQNGRIEWVPYAPLTIPGIGMPEAYAAIAEAVWPNQPADTVSDPSAQPGQYP